MPEIRRELASRQRADLLARMSAAGIPCGEVAGLHEALTSQRAVDGGLVKTMPHAEVGSVSVLASPYRFDGERLPVRSAPPKLGEGTADVLQELLGLSPEKLAALKGSGVI
jgi:crotonobetainyl-CoA:carnitine CoA-transferase CaiB-like acyl-CoA transferase